MPPALQDEDDAYHSSSDSDFDASVAPSTGEESDSNGDDAQQKNARGKKAKTDADGDLVMGSGDEGIIAQGRKKRRKKFKAKAKGKGKRQGAQEDEPEEDDNDADGIRVRLRSGRGGEDKTKKALPKSSAATIDIDSVWSRMNAPPTIYKPPPSHTPPSPGKENADPAKTSPPKPSQPAPTTTAIEETITIPHTYTFAGQAHTITKTVPISSDEAQLYLSRTQQTPTPKHTRPLARKNLLEPNPHRLINGVAPPPRTDLPPTIGGTMTKGKAVEKRAKEKEIKYNTVEKSKLDWEEEVKRLGLKEELEKAEKSKGGYLGRMEFLNRKEAEREDRERAERLKGMG